MLRCARDTRAQQNAFTIARAECFAKQGCSRCLFSSCSVLLSRAKSGDPRDAARFALLARAMPPACRAIGDGALSADVVLGRALGAAVDSLVVDGIAVQGGTPLVVANGTSGIGNSV